MTTKMEATTTFTVLGSLVVYFLGGADTLLIVTCSMIILDYVTGLSKGVMTQTINSNKGFKGILSI